MYHVSYPAPFTKTVHAHIAELAYSYEIQGCDFFQPLGWIQPQASPFTVINVTEIYRKVSFQSQVLLCYHTPDELKENLGFNRLTNCFETIVTAVHVSWFEQKLISCFTKLYFFQELWTAKTEMTDTITQNHKIVSNVQRVITNDNSKYF